MKKILCVALFAFTLAATVSAIGCSPASSATPTTKSAGSMTK